MYKALTEQIRGTLATYLQRESRYVRLEVLDRFLADTAYDHLQFPFYQEKFPSGEYIEIMRRRPSARYGIPGMVSRMLARKLFAGRHAPRLVHKNPKVKLAIQRLAEEAQLDHRRLKAAEWGAVGSVAMTFKILSDGKNARACLSVWRSKWCFPKFDQSGQLIELRVQYVCPGPAIQATDMAADSKGEPIDPNAQYWWTRDFTLLEEVTYAPIKVENQSREDLILVRLEDPRFTVNHGLNFVPAQWFENPGGDHGFDGACYWEPALPMAIDIDYTLSQCGRAVRYNASPELVVKGDLENFEEDEEGADIIRGPVNMLKFPPDQKDQEGGTISGGEAYLLEMSGEGIRTGLEYVERLKKLAMQQIAGSRKDPEKMNGPTSGKALETIDEEFIDLVQEHRSAWGDNAYLPMLKKFAKSAAKAGHPELKGLSDTEIDGLTLQWPRMYSPTAQEILEVCQGFGYAVDGGFGDPVKIQRYLEQMIDFPEESADVENLTRGDEKGMQQSTIPTSTSTEQMNENPTAITIDA